MKKYLSCLLFALLLVGCAAPRQDLSPAAKVVAQLHDPDSKQVLVACHRGDWRNYPENSIAAIESVIRMGADIVEIDLAMTADSVLVVCHDRTLNRTTTGRGRVADVTYDSIRRCCLRAGHGVATEHRMPTLREALEVCRDRIVVNIDKGYQYYDLALAVAEELGVTEQLLIKGKRAASDVASKFSRHRRNMLFMPIIDVLKPAERDRIGEYLGAEQPPLAFEVCWRELTPEAEACMRQIVAGGSKLWTNSLWPSLCGGLCDDAAFDGDTEAIYGRHVALGATIIQTDRPELLLDYLRRKGLHD